MLPCDDFLRLKSAEPSPAKAWAAARQASSELAACSEGTVFQVAAAASEAGGNCKRSSDGSAEEQSRKRQRVVSGAALDLLCTASDANTLDASCTGALQCGPPSLYGSSCCLGGLNLDFQVAAIMMFEKWSVRSCCSTTCAAAL